MAKVGERGKWAEDKVHLWLKKEKAASAAFTFNRILDARSARGMMANPQPGDFQWFRASEFWIVPGMGLACGPGEGSEYPLYTRNGLIEVKSVEHTHLLPYGNFTEDQVARMRIRAMAGSETLVLVAFRPKDHPPYWRTAPLEYFESRERRGSWDMDGIDAYTHCDDILELHLK
jgi:hypothetical protein